MLEILLIISPIFIIIGTGFAAVRTGVIPIAAIDGMMKVILTFGFPCLLFSKISRLDLAAAFDPALFVSFYTGALSCFMLGMLGARLIFNRPWTDSVVIGFAALFTNCLMLGVPITARAFGPDTLGPNFAIISIHSPICFLVGITAMELAKADGQFSAASLKLITREVVRNPLMIGLAAAFIVNLSGLTVPSPIMDSVDMLAEAALPAAIFGLGGVLTECEPKRAFGEAAMVAGLSLIIHPLIVIGLATGPMHLPLEVTQSAVLTAAMPSGLIAFVFAQLYGRATGAAASAVMFATVGSLITAPIWILILRQLGS